MGSDVGTDATRDGLGQRAEVTAPGVVPAERTALAVGELLVDGCTRRDAVPEVVGICAGRIPLGQCDVAAPGPVADVAHDGTREAAAKAPGVGLLWPALAVRIPLARRDEAAELLQFYGTTARALGLALEAADALTLLPLAVPLHFTQEPMAATETAVVRAEHFERV